MVDDAELVASDRSGLALAFSDPCGGGAGATPIKITGRAGASVARSPLSGAVRASETRPAMARVA